ncbi:ArnT family glycosyltransferase [Lacibacterium aquatile]|uniref:ArnT family glycosyltransferase n=1 Tax=Lacibacterium aquatile TaxID=1168082 RepID=A0ABW5DQ77_9PROT
MRLADWPIEIRGLILVLLLAGAALAFRPEASVFATPLTEDSYYSLAVARSVAAGIGVTVDGVQPTNGFQPLFTFIEAAAYWVTGGNEAMAVRIVLGISAVIWAATAFLLGAIAADVAPGSAAERTTRRWLAITLYLSGFLTFMHHFNGLETGCLMLVYAACWRVYQLGIWRRPAGPAVMGILLGLLVLTRIDAAIFVALFCAVQGLADLRRGFWPAAFRVGLCGVVALAVSSPWWIYNYVEFGRLMPTSGTAQQAWAVDERRLRWIFWALGVTSMPQLWLGKLDEMFGDGIVLSILRAAIGVLLIRALWRAAKARNLFWISDDKGARTLMFGGILAAALLVLCLYYGFSFIAYWFYYRYLFPTALLATVAFAWLVAPWAMTAGRKAALVLTLLALPTLISAGLAQTGRTLHVDTVYWQQIELIDRHVPKDEPVAAGQTGTLGYFRKATVNVDGKVNRAAIPYQDRMWEYLKANNVHWFADWPNYVEKYLGPDPGVHGWKLHADLGFWRLWKYEGP